MNRPIPRQMRRQLERDNAKLTESLEVVPQVNWPNMSYMTVDQPSAVWRSRRYLVQGFFERDGVYRLSINKTEMRPDGRWSDGLTWDELQDIKRQLGFADCQAIEIYPRDRDIVNVANMRHLWVLREPLNIGWVQP